MPQQDVAWAIQDVRDRAKAYAHHRAYYEGDHRLTFATDKFRNAFGLLFQEFADNLCRPVVDTFVDRLQVNGWEAVDQGLAQAATDLWDDNRMDSRSGEAHLNAQTEGDGFVTVWHTETGVKKARLWPQPPAQMAVVYDDDNPDRILKAARLRRTPAGPWRCTLYYADGLEVWEAPTTRSGALPDAKRFRLLEEEPNPYGIVPVFHLPNGALGRYGRSDLVDVVPLQDALNKAVADMLVAMEFHAYPQRWATGLEVQIDPETGQEVNPLRGGAERLWSVPSEGTSFGQFATADLKQFLEVQDSFRVECARISGTPLHSLMLVGSGAPPSGESLKVAEGRMIKRAKDRQRDYGDVWTLAAALGLVIEGKATDVEQTAADLTVVWVDPEPRDEKANAETQEIKQRLGVSKRQSLLEMGYDPEEVDEMLAEAETTALDAAVVMDTLAGGRASTTPQDAYTLAANENGQRPPAEPVGV